MSDLYDKLKKKDYNGFIKQFFNTPCETCCGKGYLKATDPSNGRVMIDDCPNCKGREDE